MLRLIFIFKISIYPLFLGLLGRWSWQKCGYFFASFDITFLFSSLPTSAWTNIFWKIISWSSSGPQVLTCPNRIVPLNQKLFIALCCLLVESYKNRINCAGEWVKTRFELVMAREDPSVPVHRFPSLETTAGQSEEIMQMEGVT